MSKRDWNELLKARQKQGLMVCVGLDSELGKIPKSAQRSTEGETVTSFNASIVDATKGLVCAYKPNIAFYEALGSWGLGALRATVEYIHTVAPEVPVIVDAKRADIGNTNLGYAQMAFEWLRADAITVHPYLGAEALQPFLDRADKGIIVLCRTSNPGAREFQDAMVLVPDEECAELFVRPDGTLIQEIPNSPIHMPLWKYVAFRVVSAWNKNGNLALVVGATYPDELREVRQIVGDMPILIPGIGAQGGDLEKTVSAGIDSKGGGVIINSSRGIIFASNGPDFAEAARRETLKLHQAIQEALAATN